LRSPVWSRGGGDFKVNPEARKTQEGIKKGKIESASGFPEGKKKEKEKEN